MNNPFTLVNKKILVTGASSGIGRQIALDTSRMGAGVCITGRNKERLYETFQQLDKNEGHQQVPADLNMADEIGFLASSVPQLDGVVLCSGIMKTLPFKFIKEDDLNNVMQTNFTSPIMLLNSLVKNKKLKKNASIVFISSIGGNIIGTKGNGMYSASKGAINAIQKVIALELAAQGIRVNNISPGMVKTEMWNTDDATITQEQLLEDEKKYPLGYGDVTDVANASIYLLSDASKWVTGITLVLDGGFSIQ